LDANRKLHDKFYMRVNLANRRNRTYVKGTNDVFRGGHIAFTYEPFKTTTIRVEGERGTTHRVRADSALAINDGAAAGRGFSTNNQWYYTSDGEIIQRTATNPPLAIDRSGTSGNQVSLLQGQTQSVRLPNGTFRTFGGFDQYTNMLGTVDYNNRTFNVANVTVEQRIGKLSLEFAYNQQYQHEDRNDNSFGTSQTPPVLSVDGAGRPYIDAAFGGAAFKVFGNVVKAGRVAAVYPFDFGRFGKQLLVVTALHQKDLKLSQRYGLYNDAAPGLAANNGIRFRAYLDDPAFGSEEFFDRFLIPNLPETPTFKPAFYYSSTVTGPFVDIRYARTQTASLSGDYFNGRVSTLLGVSWNALTRKVPKESAHVTDARGRFIHPGMPEDNPSAYEYDPVSISPPKARWRASRSRPCGAVSAACSSSVRIPNRSTGSRARCSSAPTSGPSAARPRKSVSASNSSGSSPTSFVLRHEARQRRLRVAARRPQPHAARGPHQSEQHPPGRFALSRGRERPEQRATHGKLQRAVARHRDDAAEPALARPAVARLVFGEPRARPGRLLPVPHLSHRGGGAHRRRQRAGWGSHDGRAARGAEQCPQRARIKHAHRRGRGPPQRALHRQYRTRLPGAPRPRLRIGLNGIFTPDFNVYIFEGKPYQAGAAFPLHGYLLYDRRILQKYQTTFRLGLNNIYDLMNGDSRYRITGATSFNTTLRKPNFIYRYTDPTTWTFSVTTRL
jgi:hypothetical protein